MILILVCFFAGTVLMAEYRILRAVERLHDDLERIDRHVVECCQKDGGFGGLRKAREGA